MTTSTSYLTGYLSTLSCRAGDSVDVMVSSTVPDVSVDVVRLIHGDDNPLGPGCLIDELADATPIHITAQARDTPIGSYAVSEAPISLGSRLALSIDIWPTTPSTGLPVGIFSLPDAQLELGLSADGQVEVRHAGRTIVVDPLALRERYWYRLHVTVDAQQVTLHVADLAPGRVTSEAGISSIGAGIALAAASTVILAANTIVERGTQSFPTGVFNGKLADPRVEVGANTVAYWQFEHDMASQTVPAASANTPHLRLINMPTRAMTGPSWDTTVHCWKDHPAQYNAIHFHDDDLSDASWPVSARVDIPASLPSGVYAVRLQASGLRTDYIPLAVRPSKSAVPSRIALVLSTFTYLAYANERLTESEFEQASEIPVRTGIWESLVEEHPEWGKSSYDHHNDGSGVAYSSALRPIPNMRPDYRFWGFNGPRRFSADLYIVYFLTQLGEAFDVLTEHDLDRMPADALSSYQTVITGSHPEYTSGAMLDAFEAHVAQGGGLLYLGGDGFYWVTSRVSGHPDAIEVRKSEGLRHWDAEPGERYHASTGELGGLWRTRGRSAHKLFGVGMAGHGWDNKAPGYRRSAESYRDDLQWVFEGIDDEVVGDFGLIMNGTSADEIDRIDYGHGTPPHTVVLASSEPHSEWYVPVPEDVTTVSNRLNATYNRDVRSDMVLVEHPSGGAVFSVGSISYTGALPIRGGDNNVARLTANVVRHFTNRPGKQRR